MSQGIYRQRYLPANKATSYTADFDETFRTILIDKCPPSGLVFWEKKKNISICRLIKILPSMLSDEADISVSELATLDYPEIC